VTVFSLASDALLQKRDGRWLFSNPRTRTHVALSDQAVQIVATTDGARQQDWIAKLSDVKGSDVTQEFFGEYGLHTDHSGVAPAAGKEVSGEALFNLLCKRFLLLGPDGYGDYFRPLNSILDREHIGTFHQRVGQYLTIKKRLRTERWRWWHDQKFAADGLSVNAGPYKYMQEAFMKEFVGNGNLKGKNVLDFACGNGYYSALLSEHGATVVAIDTSKELIDVANANHGGKAEFVWAESWPHEKEWLAARKNTFDHIFMQDILLLLINPEGGEQEADTQELLRLFHESLKPGGSIYMMEPDPVFWLAGRYGDPAHPYAVVTEYQQQLFNVMPTLPVVIDTMAKANFGMTQYTHPAYQTDSSETAKERAYANEFAIWDFMCFRPLGK
jgi:2-polyprenyl-3-methyl-5-hydroxy-6-metoxy-1,4-benzoquinol methylase